MGEDEPTYEEKEWVFQSECEACKGSDFGFDVWLDMACWRYCPGFQSALKEYREQA